MTKKYVFEQLREQIRRERIYRDQGDNFAHDRIQHLTKLLNELTRLKGAQAKSWMESKGFYDLN